MGPTIEKSKGCALDLHTTVGKTVAVSGKVIFPPWRDESPSLRENQELKVWLNQSASKSRKFSESENPLNISSALLMTEAESRKIFGLTFLLQAGKA